MKPDREPPLDFRHLRCGQKYRVRASFTDAGGETHYVGEEWTYLTHRLGEGGGRVFLFVRDLSGERHPIPLMADPGDAYPICERLYEHFEHILEVTEDHRLTCDCEAGEADWAEVYSGQDEHVYECFECGMVVAKQTLPESVHVYPLDDNARAAVREVSALAANVSLGRLLQAAVAHRHYPANLMSGALLAQRTDVESEFTEVLRSRDPATQRATFEFVAQMRHLPESLDPLLLEAVRRPLIGDLLRDEARWALECLLQFAGRVRSFQPKAQELAQAVRAFKVNDPSELRAPTLALLNRLDDYVGVRREERDAAIAVLRKIVTARQYQEADRWLAAWSSNHPDEDELLTCAWLSEEAGDGLRARRDRAARWLYQKALLLLESYAARAGSTEGVVRGWHMRRLQRKLATIQHSAEASKHARDTTLSVLCRQAIGGELDEAEATLAEWAQHHPDENDLLTRAWLAEDAGDAVGGEQKAAARWLYEKAMGWFQEYASRFAGGEGAARTRHVTRVRRKLGTCLM
jgi:hypothetical protein